MSLDDKYYGRKKYSREGVLGKVAILNAMVSVCLTEKVSFEQTFESPSGNEPCDCVENVPGRRNSAKALRLECAWYD